MVDSQKQPQPKKASVSKPAPSQKSSKSKHMYKIAAMGGGVDESQLVKRNPNKTSIDKGGRIQNAAPELREAINKQLQDNPYIGRSIDSRQKVSFTVERGGKLVAKNSRGEVLYQGQSGEFKEHDGLKVNASPEKRRLGELLLTKDTLKEKQRGEGRAQPHITPDNEKKLDKHAENQAIKDKGFRVTAKAYNLGKTATAPVRALGRGTGRVINWAKDSPQKNSEQKLDKNQKINSEQKLNKERSR